MQTRYISGSSAAYDLDKFSTRPLRKRDKKPTLTVRRPSEKARAKHKAFFVMKMITAAILVSGIIATMLYSRAMITELSQQINAANAQLKVAKSESTRLSAELESKVSLRNVEAYATEILGMCAIDKSQVTYIDLSGGDKVELTSDSPKQTIFDRISLAISNVQEYIPEQ